MTHDAHKKPKVCFVAESSAAYSLLTGEPCSTMGGAEVQQVAIAQALSRLGYDIVFLTPDVGQPHRVVTGDGWEILKTRRLFRGSRGLLGYADDFWRLFRALHRARADIYYQRTSAAITGIVALYCRLKRRPFVFAVASNLGLTQPLGQTVDRRFRRLYGYGLTHAGAVVVQSEEQMRLLRESTGRDGVLIRSTFAAPGPAELPTDNCDVLWVGTIRDVKNPMMMLDVAERLDDLRFTMIGGPSVGEESLFDEVRARAAEMGNVSFVGAVPYDHVGGYFAGASLFANTSRAEGFPNTFLQAWCRGVPVVATVDPDELISRYELGRHCSTDDEMADAIRALADDAGERQAIGAKARQYAAENHSPSAVGLRYDKLFSRLLSRTAGSDQN